MRRIVLVRHGETEGQSSIRYHGATDVGLSAEGEAQMRAVAASFGTQDNFDAVVASSMRRAWQAAKIVGRGEPVRLEAAFREIDFGRWEGLTREEIQASDPVLYEDWQNGAAGFEFPNGETRAAFRARVGEGVDRLMAELSGSVLVVVHRGVARAIAEKLTGTSEEGDALELGDTLELHYDRGAWHRGRVGSNPPSVESAVSLEVQVPAA